MLVLWLVVLGVCFNLNARDDFQKDEKIRSKPVVTVPDLSGVGQMLSIDEALKIRDEMQRYRKEQEEFKKQQDQALYESRVAELKRLQQRF